MHVCLFMGMGFLCLFIVYRVSCIVYRVCVLCVCVFEDVYIHFLNRLNFFHKKHRRTLTKPFRFTFLLSRP